MSKIKDNKTADFTQNVESVGRRLQTWSPKQPSQLFVFWSQLIETKADRNL